jgi:hypothetical protein
MEAAFYGVIVWGVVFALLLWLTVGGIRMGFNAVLGLAGFQAAANRISDEDLKAAGLTQEQMDKLRARVDNLPQEIRQAAHDPRTRTAAWWTFGGIIVSMIASVAGALVGAGPRLIVTGLGMRTASVGMSFGARESASRVDH